MMATVNRLTRGGVVAICSALALALALGIGGSASTELDLRDAAKVTFHAMSFVSVANGAATRDRMCYQLTPGVIGAIVAADAAAGATFGTVEQPYDEARAYVQCRPGPIDP